MILKLPEVRARLGVAPDKDADLQARIKAVESLFIQEIDRDLDYAEDVEYVIILRPGQSRFRLRRYPVFALRLVEWPSEEDRPDFDDEDLDPLIQDRHFYLLENTGSVEFTDTGMSSNIKRVVAQVTGGLIGLEEDPPLPVPEDMREALILQVMQTYVVNRADSVGIQQRRQGGKAGDLVTFDRTNGDRHPAFEAAIEIYRRR